jgi:hypothetical protein
MVLAPADFYAYSRATGAPVPQTPEERAQIATDVLEFRRNQLKAPEEKPDTLKAIGAATLAVAGALGAGFGAKKFLDRRAQIPKGPAKSATAGVRQADLSKMMDELEPATKVDLTGLQESTAPLQRGQTFEALDSGQAQMEQRVEMNVRRNEDVDLTEFAINKEIANQSTLPAGAAPDVATNVAASKLPDGLPLDQAERSLSDPWAGSATVPLPQRSTDIFPEIKLLPSSAVSPRDKAQQFLQETFEELGKTVPGRYKRERLMGEDPAIAEAMELYASTGDPSVLARLSAAPSSPTTVKFREQTEFELPSLLKGEVGEEVPTGQLFQAKQQGEFIEDLLEKDIDLTNKISQLSLEKQQTANRIQEIEGSETMLRFAGAEDPYSGAEDPYYTILYNKLQAEKQQLDPSSYNADIGDALAQRDFVRGQLESAKALGPKFELTPRQEGIRPFYQQTAEGQIIPETLELRSGRRSVAEGVVDKAASGGGIRGRVAEYDPDTQVGSSIGAYGIEPRNIPIADPELKPTTLQREEAKVKLKQVPTGQEALEEYVQARRRAKSASTEQKKQSLIKSERIRRDIINRGGF